MTAPAKRFPFTRALLEIADIDPKLLPAVGALVGCAGYMRAVVNSEGKRQYVNDSLKVEFVKWPERLEPELVAAIIETYAAEFGDPENPGFVEIPQPAYIERFLARYQA